MSWSVPTEVKYRFMDESHSGHLRLPGLIAIGGGIGAGKSVVCRILCAMGYEVYDCDSRARILMNGNQRILAGIEKEICPSAITVDNDGIKSICRPVLAEAVFADRNLLEALNRLVHGEVRDDIRHWYSVSIKAGVKKPLFVESAIVVESGIDFMVDAIWEVVAPEKVRIARVGRRDGLDEARIRAELRLRKKNMATAHCPVATIENDGVSAVMPHLLHLLGGFSCR